MDITQFLAEDLDLMHQVAVLLPRPRTFQDQLVPPSVSRIMIPPSTSSSEDDGYASSNDEAPGNLEFRTWVLDPGSHRTRPHFVGKTPGGLMMMQDVIDLKHRMTGVPLETASQIVGGIRARRPHYWQIPPVRYSIRLSFDLIHIHPQWEQKCILEAPNPAIRQYEFPDADLLNTLVDSYFRDVNTVSPLLHRPTFDRSVRDGLHFQDDGFARVLLAVCAVASRFVDDPRVLLDDYASPSEGWKYFNQVEISTKPLLAAPSLYDIQVYCVSACLTLLPESHECSLSFQPLLL
jgi:hypothetical protein